MRKAAFAVIVFCASVGLTFLVGQQSQLQYRHIPLPTSKYLIGATPGVIGRLNGFTPTIALSPDRHYAALLNDGYGTQQNKAHQSIAILDLTNNQLADFPEERLGEDARQSYFIGLASVPTAVIFMLQSARLPMRTVRNPVTRETESLCTAFSRGK